MESYWVIAYYYLSSLEDPEGEIARQKEFFKGRDLMGRIYISEQGINAQMSASAAHGKEYVEWMRSDPRFNEVSFKIHEAKEHAFPKATIKYRKQLVAIDCEIDLSQAGEKVSPAVWKKMLEEEPDRVLIDVRNDYEWQVGHFEGADLPPFETFREFPPYVEQLKKTSDPKETPVFMYCTGGIRCEFYSALLKKEGFEKVYQLEGGVINYGLQEGSSHWKGKLFVFDDRLVIPIDGEAAEPISACRHCGASNDVYYNCANMDCNELFLCCPDCLKQHAGCCTALCASEGRVRPLREDGSSKPFRKWDYQEKQAWKQRSCETSS